MPNFLFLYISIICFFTLSASANAHTSLKLTDYQANILRLATHGKLKKAIKDTKKLLKSNPKNSDLHLIYARLLFWNNQPKKAKVAIEPFYKKDPKLYKKIYLSWALKLLKEKPDPKSKIDFIHTLDTNTQKSYDILLIHIQSSIALKKLGKALKLSHILAKHYPKSREANELYARLLFWNKDYDKSLLAYNNLTKHYGKHYQKEINQINTLKHHHRSITTKTTPQTHTLTEESPNLLLNKSKLEYLFGLGYNYADYTDNRYKDHTYFIESTLYLLDRPLYLRLNKVFRYGLLSYQLTGEYYPQLMKPHWRYFNFSFAPKSKFLAQYALGFHHFYTWGKWQVGFGYEWSRYATEDVHTLFGEYLYYLTDTLYFRQSASYIPTSDGWSVSLQIKEEKPEHLQWYTQFTMANNNENSGTYNVFIHSKNKRIEAGGEYPLHNISIGGHIGMEYIKGQYDAYHRTDATVFLRYYW